jgi:hypothetical protein
MASTGRQRAVAGHRSEPSVTRPRASTCNARAERRSSRAFWSLGVTAGAQFGGVPVQPAGHAGTTQFGGVPVRPAGHAGTTQFGGVPVQPAGHAGTTQFGGGPVWPAGHGGAMHAGGAPP